MVEPQPSKLTTWVRFPSSAPFEIYVEIVDVFILSKNVLQKNSNIITIEIIKAAEEFYQTSKKDNYEL